MKSDNYKGFNFSTRDSQMLAEDEEANLWANASLDADEDFKKGRIWLNICGVNTKMYLGVYNDLIKSVLAFVLLWCYSGP